MNNIISIQSAPRSGSSWLLEIFNSSPNTKCVYQPLFSYSFKNYFNNKEINQDTFNNFINQIKNTQDEFCNMKTTFHTNNDKNNLFEFEKNNITHVVMKHVTHHYLTEKMLSSNQNLKIIFLYREPEDVINSQIKAKKENLEDWLNGKDRNIDDSNFFGFNKWCELNELFFKLKKKFNNNILFVKYENLLNDTFNEVKKIFNFCEIKMTDETINFIELSTTKHDDYDYSCLKNSKILKERKNNLPEHIKSYIQKNKNLNLLDNFI